MMNSFLAFATVLFVLVSLSVAHPESRYGARSPGERALFGYGNTEDCLFGITPAFLPEESRAEGTETADDEDDYDGVKPVKRDDDDLRDRVAFLMDNTLM